MTKIRSSTCDNKNLSKQVNQMEAERVAIETRKSSDSHALVFQDFMFLAQNKLTLAIHSSC